MKQQFPKERTGYQKEKTAGYAKEEAVAAAFLTRFTVPEVFPSAWVFVTAGMRTVPTELVTADGKRIQGSAMPVSTP